MKILDLNSRSVTIERENESAYFSKDYVVYLNDEVHCSDNRNVITIYHLIPDTHYILKIEDEILEFDTLKENKMLFSKDFHCAKNGIDDDTVKLQSLIMCCKDHDTIFINEGTYFVTSLYFKSNITIYFDKNVKFVASTKRQDYPIHPHYQSGIWEGSEVDNFASILNFINVENVKLIGEFELDCNALNGDWYINHRVINIAYRGHAIFMDNASNIKIIGMYIHDSQSWAVHPYNSNNIAFYNLKIINIPSMPTTDGIDPDCCNHLEIKGCYFNVGDDCIAIKSGTYELAKKYRRACSNLIIENNFMEQGHGGVVFGSESSGGINHVVVRKCIFKNTDRGLRIKTRRGRGNVGSISDVIFDNILMDNVKTPFVINSYYNMGPKGGHTEYVYTRKKLPVDEYTPVLGDFVFSNMICNDVHFAAACLLGLPEMPIKSVKFKNVIFNYAREALSGQPVMEEFPKTMSKQGIYYLNVENIIVEDCVFNGAENELIEEEVE